METSKEIQEYIAKLELDMVRLSAAKRQALGDLCEAYHRESGLKVGDIVEVAGRVRGIYLGFRVTEFGGVRPEVAQITKSGKAHTTARVYIFEYQPGILKKV